MRLFTTSIALLFFSITNAQTFTRQDINTINPPLYGAKIEWVDVDNDGDLDQLAFYSDYYNSVNSYIKLYQNNAQVFTEVPNAFNINLDPLHWAFGDHDADGDVDLLVLDRSTLRIAVNLGNLTFTIQDLGIESEYSGSRVHWFDFDNDADPDILILPGGYTSGSSLYLNNGGAYTPSVHKLQPNLHDLSWGDINNDGRPDMVASKGATYLDPLYLFLNEGEGIFTEVTQLSPVFNKYYGLSQWLDADGDGDLDLFAAEDGKLTIFKNTLEQGQATLVRAYSLPDIGEPNAQVGDVNLDGLADIVITGNNYPSRKTWLFKNTTSNNVISFVLTDLGLDHSSTINLQLVDMDRDMDLDIYLSGQAINYARLETFLKTTLPAMPLALAAPTGLTTTQVGDIVISWTPTSSHSIFYNWELKRDGQLFRSGLTRSDGTLFQRQTLEPTLSLSRKLQFLPAGTYEWRVQAIDAAYRTSPFSNYESFVISDPPTNLQATALDFNRLSLSWTETTPPSTEYAVFRQSTHSLSQEIARLPAGTINYIDENIPANETFRYQVRGVNGNAYSESSNTVTHVSSLFEEIPFEAGWPNINLAVPFSADIDGDNDYDIGFLGRIDYFSGRTKLLENDGNGTYTPGPLFSFTNDYSSNERQFLIPRDMDNDGDMDIVMVDGNYGWQTIDVYHNNSGVFQKVFSTEQYQRIWQVEVEDLNHDGRPDLFFKHQIGNGAGTPFTYKLLFQTQTSNFIDSAITFSSESAPELGNFILHDMNLDSFKDIVFLGINEVKSKIFINLQGNGFSEVPTNLKSIPFAIILDYNADSYPDIISLGFNELYIYEGKPNYQFSEPSKVALYNGIGSYSGLRFRIADVDLNGRPDIVAFDTSRGAILLGQPDGTFHYSDLEFNATETQEVIFTDMENDGDLDLLRISNDGYHIGINAFYRNRFVSASNAMTPPTAPTQLKATTTSAGLKLTWAASTDDNTPAALISYTVEITDSNDNIILNSESTQTGAFRQRIDLGNAGYVLKYMMNGLSPGQYKARVQALDASFIPSAWSTQINFSIDQGPENLTLQRLALHKVKLIWSNLNSTALTIAIQRKSLGKDYENIAIVPASTSEYIDNQLSYNNQYAYRVVGSVINGFTAASNEVVWSTDYFALEETTLPNVTGSIHAADLTGDGRSDLMIHGYRIVNGYIGAKSKTLFEFSETGWIPHEVGSTVLNHTARTTLFDFDGDHSLDLFQIGGKTWPDIYTDYTEIFLNKGNSALMGTSNVLTDQSYGILNTWDFDSDNDLDIYAIKRGNNTTDRTQLLKNNGEGNFVLQGASESCGFSSCGYHIVPADFDNDGDEDLLQYAYTSEKGYGYYLFVNNFGVLANTKTVIFNSFSPSVQPIDIDNDGWIDLFIAGVDGSYSYDKGKIFKNRGLVNGQIMFELVLNNIATTSGTQYKWIDFDHDGDIDLVTSAYGLIFYLNNGQGVFTEYRIPNMRAGNNLTWIDFDNDGDLDLYITGYFAFNGFESVDQTNGFLLRNRMIENQTGMSNAPPSAPAQLTQLPDGRGGVMLSWTAPFDDHTPTAALSYEVVTYKNGKAVSKGNLNVVTGKRQALQRGRTQTKLRIGNLGLGTYTWKVQAIDQSFSGSPLSEESSFTIAPTITDFSPPAGVVGSTVTIFGYNFDPTIASNSVMLNGVLAKVKSASATAVTIEIPKGVGSGKFAITVNGITGYAINSFVVLPHIQSFSPTRGIEGTEVEIKGSSFAKLADRNMVSFNGIEAVVVTATDTLLKVMVPKGAVTGKIKVQVGAESGLSISDFIVPLNQTISFQRIASRALSESIVSLSAVSTSGLPISFSSTSSNVTISGNQLRMVGAGSVMITASQTGNDLYLPAAQVSQIFCINPRKPVVSSPRELILESSNPVGNQWFKDGVALPNEVKQTLVTLVSGSYSVQTTIEGCSSEISDAAVLLVTGLEKINIDSFVLFPNPVEDWLSILSPSLLDGNIFFEAYDVNGRKVLSEEIHWVEGKATLFISNISPGIYSFSIHGPDILQRGFFVKR